SGTHLFPLWMCGKPYDNLDVAPFNRMPWRLLNVVYAFRASTELGSVPASWPRPARRILEAIPFSSPTPLPAIRRGQVIIKPAIERLMANRVSFVDGSVEQVDRIIYATGYRISLPFLRATARPAKGRD